MAGFASPAAYEYALRTPSPRRLRPVATSSPDVHLQEFTGVTARQLFPQELRTPPRKRPGAVESPVKILNQCRPFGAPPDRAPLRPIAPYEYSDRLIPSRASSNLVSGLDLLTENASPQLSPGDHANEDGLERLLRAELLGQSSPQPACKACASDREELLRTPERTGSLFRFRSKGEDEPSLSPSLFTGSTCLETPRRVPRKFPQAPYKVLSAPELEDDYYLSVLDWSSENNLVVGLGSSVDIWHGWTGRASRLCNVSPASVSSLRWSHRPDALRSGEYLAVGLSSGHIQIWDASLGVQMRSHEAHGRRTCALAWAGASCLFTGSQDTKIFRWDLRLPAGTGPVQQLQGHTEEVCGLAWSEDSQMLASGGNEGAVCAWSGQRPTPELRLGPHAAAAKALAWSPWSRGVLATGGGTADRTLRLWNTLTNTMSAEIDTLAQVCSLAWSPINDGELYSTHGFSTCEVNVWKAQSGGGLARVHSLQWHKARVLHLALSPDGQTAATGTGNEMLCFWNLLAPGKHKASTPCSSLSLSIPEVPSLSRTIR
mmetsp:Transcript_4491/g.10453  ORF Transcript_4491/g.10453 Transcript_4491/m.10453 type:complete len:544 (-) Transcript_4491:172-1803(-)